MASKSTNSSDIDILKKIIDALKNSIKNLDDDARQTKGLPLITVDTTWNQLLKKTQLKPEGLKGNVINGYSKPNYNKSVSDSLKNQLCEKLGIQWDDSVNDKAIREMITTYIDNLSAKRSGHHHNGGGRSGGCQNVLLGRIIDAIIKANFMGTESWPQIIKVLAPDYSDINAQTISSRKKAHEENKCKGIARQDTLNQIAETLGFDPKFWDDVYGIDDQTIDDCVTNYKQTFVGRIRIDISQFTSYMIDTAQPKTFLTDLQQAISRQTLAQFFAKQENLDFLNQLSDCQIYQRIFLMLYEAGAYRFIQDYILPHAAGCLEDSNIRYFLAHYYGSAQIQQYQKAAQLLNNFTFKNIDDEADIKTSMLSNILRNAFLTTPIKQWTSEAMENLFDKMCEAYAEVFQQHPHYYPGINYAYMLYLGQTLFSTNNKFHDDTIEAIFESCKTSIENERNSSNPYYAVISELEFQALLNRLPRTNLENTIEASNPTSDMMLRTLRRLDFVLDVLLRDETDKLPNDANGLQTLRTTLQNLLGIQTGTPNT